MKLSWFGDFFGSLDDALRGLYRFGDPAGTGDGWWGFVILFIWGAFLIALPLYLARKWYGEREWASATMGVIAGLALMWWAYGILPSAWIYYLDSNKEVLSGNIIPNSAGITFSSGYRIDIASNLYDVIRDLVVVIEHFVAFVLTFWAALRIQKQLPKTLVPGEVKPEGGGYK